MTSLAAAGGETRGAAKIIEAILTPDGQADPYPLYADLHRIGDVASLGPGHAVAYSYQAVSTALREPEFLVKDAAYLDEVWPQWREHPSLLQHSLLTTNPPDHGRIRSLLASTFTPRRVAQLEPAIEGVIRRLADELREFCRDRAPADFMAAFAYQLPVTVICELLGVPEEDRETFRPRARDLALGIDFMDDPDLVRAADEAAIWLHDYFGRLAATRRSEPRDDLITALVQAAEADGSISDADLLGNLTLLLFAGFETTTNLLGNGLHLIMTSPAVEAGLRSGEVGVPEFVSEVLRYDPPVQAGTDRWCPADSDLCGVPLAAGSSVIVLIGAANRDPRRFADPDVFDPSRRDGAALSFGAGPHYCLGAALARLEGQLAFRYLMTTFLRLTPAGDPVRRGGVALRGFDRLPVMLA